MIVNGVRQKLEICDANLSMLHGLKMGAVIMSQLCYMNVHLVRTHFLTSFGVIMYYVSFQSRGSPTRVTTSPAFLQRKSKDKVSNKAKLHEDNSVSRPENQICKWLLLNYRT